MATVKCFEDLTVWQSARQPVRRVYHCSSDTALAKDFPLLDQLRRAAISIMANIAEGFERRGDKEFAQFLAVAKGSCGETRSLLVIARDQNYIADSVAAELDAACRDISRTISGLQLYLSKSHKPGRRIGGNAAVE